jgi:large subunit ribosomal protein L31
MKKQGHPAYQEVLFVDSSTGYKFVCGSTMHPKETEAFEGKTYPVCRLPISSASHPFFNKSKQQFIDTEGRVDRFTKRYAVKRKAQAEAVAAKEDEKEAEKEAAKKKRKKK